MSFPSSPAVAGRLTAGLAAQKGLVLFVSLIVLVAMSLAAIALVRSVDTATQITGNLSFRGGGVQESDQGVEAGRAAVAAIVNTVAINNDSPANNYYASVQDTTDAATLARLAGLGGATFNAATGNTINYIVERMCSTAGPWSVNKCSLFVSRQRKDQQVKPGEPTGGQATPYYRVTVMVTGQRGTRVFTQTIFYMI